jgi:hypothetical protein
LNQCRSDLSYKAAIKEHLPELINNLEPHLTKIERDPNKKSHQEQYHVPKSFEKTIKSVANRTMELSMELSATALHNPVGLKKILSLDSLRSKGPEAIRNLYDKYQEEEVRAIVKDNINQERRRVDGPSYNDLSELTKAAFLQRVDAEALSRIVKSKDLDKFLKLTPQDQVNKFNNMKLQVENELVSSFKEEKENIFSIIGDAFDPEVKTNLKDLELKGKSGLALAMEKTPPKNKSLDQKIKDEQDINQIRKSTEALLQKVKESKTNEVKKID